MFFNSLDFAIFLPIVFLLYWFVVQKNIEYQNALIVVSSYVFYSWWDWRFLSLIIFSTIIDYSIGQRLRVEHARLKRKILLGLSILINIGFLGFFKYYNFFLENFVSAFSFLGYEIQANSLNIILPVGISFYTFQTLSYTIDVYRKKIQPTKDFVAFSAFVCFFPQLVAGPIERATHFLPQFYHKRSFEYTKAADGLRQILWGLFKKIVIADNCAYFANQIFNNSIEMNGSSLALGAIFFSFQIYGDFSGYSDIAIGTSRLFGFDLKQNFSYPYFSRDIAEFWRRWHISLSTWFRDYLYIPLGGSKGGALMKIRNTFIIFLVSGFWHGANWTFIVWGVLNALYFLPLLIRQENRKNLDIVAEGKYLPTFKELRDMLFTFILSAFAWIFFRAENIGHAYSFIGEIFSLSFFDFPNFSEQRRAFTTIVLIGLFMLFEWVGREKCFAIQCIGMNWRRSIRFSFYYVIVISILWFSGKEQEFIYFQF